MNKYFCILALLLCSGCKICFVQNNEPVAYLEAAQYANIVTDLAPKSDIKSCLTNETKFYSEESFDAERQFNTIDSFSVAKNSRFAKKAEIVPEKKQASLKQPAGIIKNIKISPWHKWAYLLILNTIIQIISVIIIDGIFDIAIPVFIYQFFGFAALVFPLVIVFAAILMSLKVNGKVRWFSLAVLLAMMHTPPAINIAQKLGWLALEEALMFFGYASLGMYLFVIAGILLLLPLLQSSKYKKLLAANRKNEIFSNAEKNLKQIGIVLLCAAALLILFCCLFISPLAIAAVPFEMLLIIFSDLIIASALLLLNKRLVNFGF